MDKHTTVDATPDPVDRARALDWPDCIQCGSGNTTVVPKTGEWTCQDCGCQWTSDETPADDGDADEIPENIEAMVRELVHHLNTEEHV